MAAEIGKLGKLKAGCQQVLLVKNFLNLHDIIMKHQ